MGGFVFTDRIFINIKTFFFVGVRFLWFFSIMFEIQCGDEFVFFSQGRFFFAICTISP
jgi:hypothetical protein